MTQSLFITVPEDSGNIEIVDASRPADIRLAIRPDGKAAYHQWFYFRVDAPAGTDLGITIENAGSSSYPNGWKDYGVCVSGDLDTWTRVPTRYDGKTLAFDLEADGPVYVAYFAPYPVELYRDFLASLEPETFDAREVLGLTLDGEPLEHLQVGTPGKDKRQLWVIARQHPGETMGSWWMEGFLSRLADPDDAVVRALREQAVLHIVPLVNIDGARRGHLRTNAAGADLNREWAEPSAERSPEVLAIRGAMDKHGCDFFLDVHGDEAIANNFIAGAEGIPKWSDAHQTRLDGFLETLKRLSPAFQTEEGYPIDRPGAANLKIAANQIAERFDCLSMTLEMPFKDAKIQPDPEAGWSPGRCRDLGRACLDAIWQSLPGLR